jgi:hypothetical protein
MDGTSSSSRLPGIPFLSRIAPARQSQFLFKCIREQVGKGKDAPALEAFEATLETRGGGRSGEEKWVSDGAR